MHEYQRGGAEMNSRKRASVRAADNFDPEELEDPLEQLIMAIATSVPEIDKDNLIRLVLEAVQVCGSIEEAAETVKSGLKSGEITLQLAS
jgi:hypothetical protein